MKAARHTDGFDALQLVEAAYAQVRDDRAWLRGLLAAAQPLQYGASPMTAYLCDGSSQRWSAIEGIDLPFAPERLEQAAVRFRAVATTRFPAYVRRAHTFGVGTQRELFSEVPMTHFAPLGSGDALGIVATDPTHRGCALWCIAPRPIELPPRRRHTLRMVAAHLAAASRLRQFHTAARSSDAVLDSKARVLHAEGDAIAPSSRAALIEAVRRSERARGRLRRTSPDEALGLWQALVAGRWSIVDRIDTDGRRFLLARRNEPGVIDPRALNSREQQVASHAVLGQSNKLIGYQLGLGPSTVAGHLSRACRKLGVHSRAELIAVFRSDVERGSA